MCNALRELFAEEIEEGRQRGKAEGKIEGKIEGRIEGKCEGDRKDEKNYFIWNSLLTGLSAGERGSFPE